MSNTRPVAWALNQAHVAVPIDLRLFTLGAVMRAAYRLTDRCFVWLEHSSEDGNALVAYVIGRSPTADVGAAVLELQNELVDQQLRVQLEEQFKDVRTLIVAQAFSEGNLIDPNTDEGDYRNDPVNAGKHR
jgi:His-Xaa-Ser system protein HxsD